jgi:alginate O-acetyltransferase complex protein AlgI
MELKLVLTALICLLLLILFHFKKGDKKKEILLILCIIIIGYFNFQVLVLVLLISLINFYLSRKIALSLSALEKKYSFFLAIIFNCSIFFFFKLEAVLFETGIFDSKHIFLALGMSFYTLNNIAFIIDTNKKRIDYEVTFKNLLLSNLYFPKFISGPIISVGDFSKQLNNIGFCEINLSIGLKRILYGLIKKMVIADRLSETVIYNFDIHPHDFGFTNLFVAFLFAIQLYFDFSGYSDIAIGVSRIFGITLPENFNFPFKSSTITEFWRRWHITLTSWLSTYVYYPISFHFRKKRFLGVVTALILTFFISGIWHGVHVSLVIYALLHATFLVIEFVLSKIGFVNLRFIPRWIVSTFGRIYVFCIVSLSFVFLRNTNWEKSWLIAKSIFNSNSFLPTNFFNDFIAKLATGGELDLVFNFYITVLLVLFFMLFNKRMTYLVHQEKFYWIYFIVGILLIVLFGQFVNRTQFIYSQF